MIRNFRKDLYCFFLVSNQVKHYEAYSCLKWLTVVKICLKLLSGLISDIIEITCLFGKNFRAFEVCVMIPKLSHLNIQFRYSVTICDEFDIDKNGQNANSRMYRFFGRQSKIEAQWL